MHLRGRGLAGVMVVALPVALAASVARGNCFPHWQPVGDGLVGAVSTLMIWNGELYAGGGLAVGGTPARIARWDGTQWWPYGGALNNWVNAMVPYNGELIVGGEFSLPPSIPHGIARWDGTQWQSLGGGILGSVNALLNFRGDLIVGGRFTTNTCPPVAATIARWDGEQWGPLGTGVSGTLSNLSVYALTEYEGDLIVGGRFTQAGGSPANYIARWDGVQWLPLGEGVDDQVIALLVYNGDLIAGGSFQHAGGQPASRIARWDGAQWGSLDDGVGGSGLPPASVYVLAVHDAELVAGGVFSTAGGQPANNIARWDGLQWQPLDSGMTGPNGGSVPDVQALATHEGDLIAGGGFAFAGGRPVNHVARWGCPPGQGDMNCDGTAGYLSFGDINPFVLYLSNFSAWQATYPGCDPTCGDINGDGTYGQLSFGDINPFVALLSGG